MRTIAALEETSSEKFWLPGYLERRVDSEQYSLLDMDMLEVFRKGEKSGRYC